MCVIHQFILSFQEVKRSQYQFKGKGFKIFKNYINIRSNYSTFFKLTKEIIFLTVNGLQKVKVLH